VDFLISEDSSTVPAFGHDDELLDNTELIQADKSPLLPLHRSEDIFFNTYSNEIIIPPHIKYSTKQNYIYRSFTLSFEDIVFETESIPLSNSLPTGILLESNRMTFYAQRGLFLENGQFIDPRERYQKIVVLDAGHGGNATGAYSVHKNAPPESKINLAITQKIMEIYERQEMGVLIVPTRTEDVALSVTMRTQMANSIGDYFISIHCNSDDKSSRSGGTLTLYGTAEGSEELAETFQSALVEVLGSRDMGISYAPQFHVLRESKVPVILLELLFLSNPQEATRLADEDTQLLIAKTIVDEIMKLPPRGAATPLFTD